MPKMLVFITLNEAADAQSAMWANYKQRRGMVSNPPGIRPDGAVIPGAGGDSMSPVLALKDGTFAIELDYYEERDGGTLVYTPESKRVGSVTMPAATNKALTDVSKIDDSAKGAKP